jgi:V8-like Glu-specific endopeptidase
LKELLWTSPPGELDATLLRLEDTLTCEPPYPLAIELPAAKDDRVYIIGHPNGGPLSISMQDNRVIEVKDPKIQYRAPTEPGSSGSPVFNQKWQLVALHHAGSKQMPSLEGQQFVEANEGIWINAVVAAIGKKFEVGNAAGV